MYERKVCRGVMCHGNQEWCEIWRGIDLSVQNWHKQFNEFWPKHSKISKNLTLMGCFWQKYRKFELRKHGGVMFEGTEDCCKNWRKTGAFKINMNNLANAYHSSQKSQN